MKNKNKKIAICHYRVGGTDGVSLEIKKRKQILESCGCEVKLIAGSRSEKADYMIEELEWEDNAISIIKRNGFVKFNGKDFDNLELADKILKVSEIIEKKLDEIQEKEQFDCVLIHNIFCFGGHIAAARSFYHFIEKYQLQTIATHHDFFWERKDFRVPRSDLIKDFVETYLPPDNFLIKHVVLSSITKRELKKRRGIDSDILPDIFDFSQDRWVKDKYNSDLLEKIDVKESDLFVLKATRIVPRKGIEIAVDFVEALEKKMKGLVGETLYNGKKITLDSKLVLVLAGYYEDSNKDYFLKIKELAREKNIEFRFIKDLINSKRSFHNSKKIYSLWDVYTYADIITFPSIWEGWGNQFIEAVFAGKPVVVWEYPVFKADIKPEGYKVISLGDKIIERGYDDLWQVSDNNLKHAVDETEEWITDENLIKTLEENFKIGEINHGFSIVEEFLKKELNI